MFAWYHPLEFQSAISALVSSVEPLLSNNSVLRATPHLDPLTARSTDQTYLVPALLLDAPLWSVLRTKLATANRYFIVFGEHLDPEKIVPACRDGAFDVLDLHDSPSRWRASLPRVPEAQALWWQLYGSETGEIDHRQLIGRSPAMKALRLAVDRLGPTNASVLILGESGTGKERVAEALHTAGGRGEFVAFNCAALPADLLEAELFGVAKGAFTGAHMDRPGLVEQVEGGTLFLNEIGEMAPGVQAKLLRFLETRTARRLGSNQSYHVDLRIVAATNRNLDRAMSDVPSRPDLYYRLAEITLPLPALRERTEDIPLLARHFVDLAGTRFGKFFDAVEPDPLVIFQTHSWPGNIRELKNTLDRLVLMHDGPVLRAGWCDPPRRYRRPPHRPPPPRPSARLPPCCGAKKIASIAHARFSLPATQISPRSLPKLRAPLHPFPLAPGRQNLAAFCAPLHRSLAPPKQSPNHRSRAPPTPARRPTTPPCSPTARQPT
ncbi:MAG: sigma 54-interacting transcriptional regulator [Candidatus Synoicihabitans palmerolidicus]|nr:sigma 54-interacting transcriptional regulator [Candidatus Synoicihabitans palmerolidicus]